MTSQALNRPVDVLCVMRDVHATLGLSEGRELWDAHVAVAELIEAAGGVMHANDESDSAKRLRAALANVGGAK